MTHIHPDSSATQLGLTPEDIKLILRHQEQYLLDEYAQSLLISAKLIIHPDSSAAQLGLTLEDMEEALTHQEEQEEQEWRTGRHTIAEQTHHQCD
jgi:DNA-binding transcriptional MerR regulator